MGHETTHKKSKNSAPQKKVTPQAMERMMADVQRDLDSKGFESVEEANAYLQELAASFQVPQVAPRTPLEEAQELIYDAWETRNKRRRVSLARRALKICPDCADAYSLLAEETARSPQEACELYEQGVQAGKRALDPEMFKEEVGNFWGILSTRPYMRARFGLANCLWQLDQRKEAISHLTDMLRLNPNDNQGLRYILLHWLMAEGDDATARRLWQRYKDDDQVAWSYTGALLAFREKGPSFRANRLLKEGLQQNPFVFLYMAGLLEFPRKQPEYIDLGGPSEAAEYLMESAELWTGTSGALDWLAERAGKLLPGILQELLSGVTPDLDIASSSEE